MEQPEIKVFEVSAVPFEVEKLEVDIQPLGFDKSDFEIEMPEPLDFTGSFDEV